MIKPLPLRTDFGAASTHLKSLSRAMYAMATGELVHNDPLAAAMLKTATVPASTTTASVLGGTAISDLLDFVGPASAFKPISNSGVLRLSYDRYAELIVPSAERSGRNTIFVGEADPHPLGQLSIAGPTLKKQKLILACALARELVDSSNGEAFVHAALSENLDVGLDTILLDANEATAIRPQGLRCDVSATPASDNADPHAAMIEDIAKLGEIVSAVGGANLLFVASVGLWLKIQLWAPQLKLPIFPSGGLASGELLCLAPRALAMIGSNDPVRLEATNQAVMHEESVTPLPIGVTGSPAAPLRSTWQTDTIAFRLRAQISWTLRATGAVAWISEAAW